MTSAPSICFALFSLTCAYCWPAAVHAQTDTGIIKGHGEYSDAYLSDWSALPNGKDVARMDPTNQPFETVAGDDAKRWYSNQDRVHISGESLEVSWPSRGYDNQVYRIRDVKTAPESMGSDSVEIRPRYRT